MRVRPRWKAALAVVALAAAAATCVSSFRPWSLRWGTVDDEATRAMPGDELVAAPRHASTRAITVRARPGEIWPWLAQMGKGRGGLYSIDWLDRVFGMLDAPSAERILPEWQDLKLVMVRAQLRGIRRRAEALAEQRRASAQ